MRFSLKVFEVFFPVSYVVSLENIVMDQVILDGLQNLQLTKDEEEGIRISAPSRVDWLEECHLSLFGKLLSDRQQNIRALKSTLRSVWKLGSDLRIVEVGNDILQFKFTSKYQMEWVEKNGPWNFENNLLLLCRWRKGLTVANIVFPHSPFWIQIWGVPFELMVEETGKDVGNRIGKFLEVDKRTWQSEQAKYMRIRAELPLHKPLRRGAYLLNEEGEKVWVTFKYERLPTVCYRCGRLGHDDKHCDAKESGLTTEYQYGDWIRANGSFKGGQEKMRARKEVHPSSNFNGRRFEAQSTGEEDAMTGSGEGSKNGAVNWPAEKQGERTDIGNDGRTESQAACHTGGWDNSAASPPNVEEPEVTRTVKKSLNFGNNGGEIDALEMSTPNMGCQSGRMLKEKEVVNPAEPIMDFSEFKEEGFLDLGCKIKDFGPKTIGRWKRLAREKGLNKEVDLLGQEKRSGLKRTGELEALETEENRKAKRKQRKNTKEAAVTAVQHRREP